MRDPASPSPIHASELRRDETSWEDKSGRRTPFSSSPMAAFSTSAIRGSVGSLHTPMGLGRPSQSGDSLRLGSTFARRSLRRDAQRRSGIAAPRRVSAAVVAEVQFVSPSQAKEMVEKDGYTIVDIRDKAQHDRAYIPSSVHIPYFIENTDNDFGTVINRQLHNNFAGLFYGLAFTKPNTDFVSSVAKQFPRDSSKLLLVCQEGLRSGIAAGKLEAEGFQSIAYITQGLQKVPPGVFPKEGPKELQDAGKGGLVTIQGPVSAVVGAILVLAYLFLQFFPEQAEQLFFKP